MTDKDYSDASCNANYSNPLCFVSGGDDDEEQDAYKASLLTATMSEQDYIKLASLNVNMYVSMLQLPTNEQKSYDLVTEWLQSGCENWIRVAKGKDIPSVDIKADDFIVFQFLREFEKDGPSERNEQTLRGAAPDGVLTEQDYIDWYMLSKHDEWKKRPPPVVVAPVVPKGIPPPAPVVIPVDPFALTAEELKYIRDNNFPGRGCKSVTRTKMPIGSIDKYARKLKLTNRSALEGVTMLKKNEKDVFAYTRFFWIDHLTKTIHWQKDGQNKYSKHKSFDLCEVENISIPPKKLTRGMIKKSNSVDNHLRLKLYNAQWQDIDLPLSFSDEERWDWVTVLLDCAGFADADAASKGNRRPPVFPSPNTVVTMPGPYVAPTNPSYPAPAPANPVFPTTMAASSIPPPPTMPPPAMSSIASNQVIR